MPVDQYIGVLNTLFCIYFIQDFMRAIKFCRHKNKRTIQGVIYTRYGLSRNIQDEKASG